MRETVRILLLEMPLLLRGILNIMRNAAQAGSRTVLPPYSSYVDASAIPALTGVGMAPTVLRGWFPPRQAEGLGT